MVIINLVLVIVLTFVIGSFSGYVTHWLMHSRLTRYKLFRPLLLIHNTHHTLYNPKNFESDKYLHSEEIDSAIIFTPVVILTLVALGALFWVALGEVWVYPVMLVEGVIVGYLNLKLHEAFHIKNHYLEKYRWYLNLKHLHYIHHKYPRTNHGIIWLGLDKMFGTYRDK